MTAGAMPRAKAQSERARPPVPVPAPNDATSSGIMPTSAPAAEAVTRSPARVRNQRRRADSDRTPKSSATVAAVSAHSSGAACWPAGRRARSTTAHTVSRAARDEITACGRPLPATNSEAWPRELVKTLRYGPSGPQGWARRACAVSLLPPMRSSVSPHKGDAIVLWSIVSASNARVAVAGTFARTGPVPAFAQQTADIAPQVRRGYGRPQGLLRQA